MYNIILQYFPFSVLDRVSYVYIYMKLICIVVEYRLERKTVTRKRVFATLKVLGTVVEELTKEVSPEEAERLITEEVCRLLFSTFVITICLCSVYGFEFPANVDFLDSFSSSCLTCVVFLSFFFF